MAGVRTASVQVVATATIAAFVGAGGLGRFIIDGRAIFDNTEIFAGALLVALLSLATEVSLGFAQRALTPRGLRADAGDSESCRRGSNIHPRRKGRLVITKPVRVLLGTAARRPAAGNGVWKRQLEQQREQRRIVLRCWGCSSNVHVRAARRRWSDHQAGARAAATSTSACCSRATARSRRTTGSRSRTTRSCNRSTTSSLPSTRPRPRRRSPRSSTPSTRS